MLPGSRYGDVADFAARRAPEGLVVYVEVAEAEAVTAARMLHHLGLAGWFDCANAVLVGRSAGPPSGDFSQPDALVHALGDLLVPVVMTSTSDTSRRSWRSSTARWALSSSRVRPPPSSNTWSKESPEGGAYPRPLAPSRTCAPD
jgi:LD-carboxypeptidase C-terminal domain